MRLPVRLRVGAYAACRGGQAGPEADGAGDSASDTVTVTDRWAAGTSDSSTGPAHWQPTSQSHGAFGALGLAVSRITAITRDSS